MLYNFAVYDNLEILHSVLNSGNIWPREKKLISHVSHLRPDLFYRHFHVILNTERQILSPTVDERIQQLSDELNTICHWFKALESSAQFGYSLSPTQSPQISDERFSALCERILCFVQDDLVKEKNNFSFQQARGKSHIYKLLKPFFEQIPWY